MSDIRNFFTPKGGAAPAKPAIKKEDSAKKVRRGRSRRIADDSDEGDESTMQPKKSAARSTPKKTPAEPEPAKATEISADAYFSSTKTSKKKIELNQDKADTTTRQSPRKKAVTATVQGKPIKKPKAIITSHNKAIFNEGEDAYVDDAYEDGDDIFTADLQRRTGRKTDEYMEEESEEEVLPKPKRVGPRAKPAKTEGPEDKEEQIKRPWETAVGNVENGSLPDPGEKESEDETPRKKTAAAKPRAPRKKKELDKEDRNFQAMIDSIPTVRPPSPPPRDPNAKFDWRKAVAGGGNSGPLSMEDTADIPDGEEDCLTGMTFVFTGQLKTIGRDEAQMLVKRYGGKVTTAPSSKTTFVVLGDDAGPSKLRKIKEHGIKTIDETGLFDLIRKAPASGGGNNAAKAREKQEKEQEKIRQVAVELEEEEKSRQAEAEKARKAAVTRGRVTSAPHPTANSQLWTSRYAPTQLNHICGNKANVEKIQSWLKAWPKNRKYEFQKRGADGMGGYRAVILSGPPGIGKTTAAHLAAKLAGYDVIESNASDSRSKKLVENGVTEVMTNTSLLGYFASDGRKVEDGKKNIVLVMDEVDGMSAGDRGGVGALAKLCKKTEVPLILICNERRLPKMKPFDFVTCDIQFRRPTVQQVRSRIMTICHREGLKLPIQVVDALTEGSNRDIRQIINMLATIKLDQISMDFDQSKSMSEAWKKHVILKPWDICQKLLGGSLFNPASKATLNDKIELYFNDHEFSPLMIQENYLKAKPAGLSGKGYNGRETNMKYLELVDLAAESVSDGDLVDRMIHGPQQHWSLMPTHAVFSTVRPASFVAGSMVGVEFTKWLGNNSKLGRLSRYVREMHAHMRLKSSGDAGEIRQQYLPVLWDQLIKRLSLEGKDAVQHVIELMDSYYLTKEDFDAILELGVGSQQEGVVKIETQTKASFTRIYNANSHPLPFMKASNIVAPKKGAKEVPDFEDALEGDDDAEVVEGADADDNDDIDLKKDKYIKATKARPNKQAAKRKAAEEELSDEGAETAKLAKGHGKGKATAKRKRKK